MPRKKKHVEKPDFPVEQPDVEAEFDADSEEVSESEADAMVNRAVVQKEKAVNDALDEVDSQDWTRNDPEISEDLLQKGRVWIAVYKCPKGHKTKATNRQAESGVLCYPCREAGKKVRAEIMPQFGAKPEPPEDDLVKRKRAKKNSQ